MFEAEDGKRTDDVEHRIRLRPTCAMPPIGASGLTEHCGEHQATATVRRCARVYRQGELLLG